MLKKSEALRVIENFFEEYSLEDAQNILNSHLKLLKSGAFVELSPVEKLDFQLFFEKLNYTVLATSFVDVNCNYPESN